MAHEVLDRVLEDEDTAVVLDFSDGLVAGGKVALVRVSGEWEVVIEVGDRSFWPTYSVWQAMRGQVSGGPPHLAQTYARRAIGLPDGQVSGSTERSLTGRRSGDPCLP